jgi:hypothetical protein
MNPMIALASLILIAAGIIAPAAEAASLDRYRWTARPVLVFAPKPDDPRYIEQQDKLKNAAAGLTERDLIVIDVTNAIDPLRSRFDIAEDAFTVILIGKDGGEKARWSQPIEPDAIFSLVDAMPMRIDEMRQEERRRQSERFLGDAPLSDKPPQR